MSAPDTNVATQKRRHAGPILGMILVVVFAVGLVLWWLGEEAAEAPGPDASPAASAGAPEPAASATAPQGGTN